MKVKVFVTLKSGVLDPQGIAIKSTLNNLGFDSITSVSQGKCFEIELNETDRDKIETIIKASCEKLLANLVIENYSYQLIEK